MFDRNELRGFLTALACVAALMLLLASAPYVLPGQPLLQTLRLHIAGATLVVAILLFVFRARWRGVLLAALAFVSLGEAGYWYFTQQSTRIAMAPHSETPRFSLISYNVLIWNERPRRARRRAFGAQCRRGLHLRIRRTMERARPVARALPS
jgi:hypothetical protein